MTRPGRIVRLPAAGLLAVLALALMIGAGLAAAAEPDFPKLTGRVVDAAGILSPEARTRIDGKIKAHEDRTGDQLVVATVPSLQDLTVEDYANRLARSWGIGQKKTNNGVLLLVAPKERKVRIEVGYGLEGALTDALSKTIITSAITPRFRQGDFSGGVEAGVDAILPILAGDADEWQRRAPVREDSVDPVTVIFWIVVIIALVVVLTRMNGGGRRGRGGGFVVIPGPSGGWSGGFSDGGGGGFSGGGGSFGGGGASGDW
ncbi:UNVERIFIED_CONTAM: TPM domain-containing protein [Methylobacteriaceae bacterium AG10]|uniref:TPM domain-containing protein n=1 Tax=Methylorubrum podarium TaxID=200476 RepID=A0ABV1QIM7_9HYPH|nr:TPM domain-containing protein [Methylobacteriaceae bacterium AG10]